MNLDDIKYRIKGISQTRRITGAMETVSVAKMRKAMQKYNNNYTYHTRLRQTIGDIVRHSRGIEHKYFTKSKSGRAAFIVIAGDKGLAGAFNNNVFNLAKSEIQKYNDPYIIAVGQTTREFFERTYKAEQTAKNGVRTDKIYYEYVHAAYNPSVTEAAAITESVIRLFSQDSADEVYAVFTAMEKGSSPKAQTVKLLPLDGGERGGGEAGKSGGYYKEVFYDPSPREVLDALVPQYVTGLLYGCLVQSSAAEHTSRVQAMSQAARNAGEMIGKLNIVYHRARQEKITNETLEINGNQYLR